MNGAACLLWFQLRPSLMTAAMVFAVDASMKFEDYLQFVLYNSSPF